MAGNIKGMTVEIGGDTAPLEQALKDVNKEINSTQKELNQVNKALKLDPSNTELLRQKQQLLGDQIGKTSDKLAVLKQAQKQVEEEMKKGGNVNQEEYRKLQREIATTEASLKKLKDEAKKVHPELSKIGEGLKKVGSIGLEAGKAITNLTINGIKMMGTASIATGTALVGMAKKAGSMADDLNTLASTTGLSTKQLQEFQYASDLIDVSTDTLAGSLKKLTSQMSKAKDGTGSSAEAFKKLGVSVQNNDGTLRSNNEVFEETIRALGKISNETERDAMAMEIFGKSATELNPLIEGGIDTLAEMSKQANELGLVLSQETLDGANAFNDQLDILKSNGKGLFQALGSEIATSLVPAMQELNKESMQAIKAITSSYKEGGLNGMATQISKMLGNILNKIVATLPKIAKLGTTIVQTLVDSIKENAEMIGNSATELISTLIEGFYEILPDLIETAILLAVSFIQSFGEKLPELIPTIIDGILGMIDAIVDNIELIIQAGLQLFVGLAQGLEQALPKILAKIPEVVGKIGTVIVEQLPTIITAIGDIVIAVANTIGQSADQFVPPLIDTILALLDVIIDNLPLIIDTIFTVSEAISGALIDNIDLIIEAGVQLIVGLAKGLIKAIPKLVEKLPEIINAIVNGLLNLLGKIADVGLDLLEKLGESIVNGLYILNEAIVSIWDKIKEGLTEKFEGIKEVGKNLIRGLWNGIQDMKEWLKQKILALGDLIIDALKAVFGIESPSKVMADEVGRYLAEGIGVGFEKKMPFVIDDMTNKLSAVTDAFQTDLSFGDIPQIKGNQIISENQYITKNFSNTVETIRQPSVIELILDNTKVARAIIPALDNEYNRLGVKV